MTPDEFFSHLTHHLESPSAPEIQDEVRCWLREEWAAEDWLTALMGGMSESTLLGKTGDEGLRVFLQMVVH